MLRDKMNGMDIRSQPDLQHTTATFLPPAAHCRIPRPIPLQFEEPAEALQALRTVLDVRRAMTLDWAPAAVQQRLDAFASDKGKAPAAEAAAPTNGKSGGAKAAKAAAAQHPLAPPPDVLERLRRELRLSKLQAVTVWRALLVCAGSGGLRVGWHSAGGHACRACRCSPSHRRAVPPSLSSLPPRLTIIPRFACSMWWVRARQRWRRAWAASSAAPWWRSWRQPRRTRKVGGCGGRFEARGGQLLMNACTVAT